MKFRQLIRLRMHTFACYATYLTALRNIANVLSTKLNKYIFHVVLCSTMCYYGVLCGTDTRVPSAICMTVYWYITLLVYVIKSFISELIDKIPAYLSTLVASCSGNFPSDFSLVINLSLEEMCCLILR